MVNLAQFLISFLKILERVKVVKNQANSKPLGIYYEGGKFQNFFNHMILIRYYSVGIY